MGVGALVVKRLREVIEAMRERRRHHWYPKHLGEPHVCYYCGRYDQAEAEKTTPPCPGRTRTMLS